MYYGKFKLTILKHIVSVLLLLTMVISDLSVNVNSYAADGDVKYDTIPINSEGQEGTLVNATPYDFIPVMNDFWTGVATFSIAKVPRDTATIKWYDNEAAQYFMPTDEAFEPVMATQDNGWWTIDLGQIAECYDPFGQKMFSSFLAVMGSEDYCKEASYYELFDTPEPRENPECRHFFIQVGDENSPLNVYATVGSTTTYDYWPNTTFSGNSKVELKLGAGKRYEVFNDTNQTIWYTTDGSDPVTSSTAIEYTKDDIITVTKICTLKAAAKVSDEKWGPVSSFECTVTCPEPNIYPKDEMQFDPFDATITCEDQNAEIYYTVDGSEPVDSDGNIASGDNVKKYTDPIEITEDTVIKAVAVSGGIVSEVLVKKYNLSCAMTLDFYDDDQGVWLREDTFAGTRKGNIITPYGHSKCKIIANIKAGATLKFGDKMVAPDENDKFVLNLDVKENADLNDYGQENIITVSNEGKEYIYKIYCIASLTDDLPDRIKDYFVPASQYTNNGTIGCGPNKTLIGKCGSVLQCSSLGNFGGYIIWEYDDGIKNDLKNPYGVDFIVFGNSFDGTNEAAEPGNIMVSDDGEHWYTLAGSIHYDENAKWNQQVTYTNEDGYTGYDFKDLDMSGSSKDVYPVSKCYPFHKVEDDYTLFTTKGTFLTPDKGINEYGNVRPPYPAFGYADTGLARNNNNEAANPYAGIVRDISYPNRVTTNRNGDACDISWAVDENGNPVELDEIHYIKVQTASFIYNGAIGEKSTEVSCMRIAKPADSAVGTTAAPSSIKIDGTNMDLKPGEMVNANVRGVFDVAVDAPDDANVYINSLRSHTAYMDKAPHGIVRVIVQEGEKEPLIYYFKINQSADQKTVTKVTLDAGKGLLQDKEKVDCYFDEDTFEHAGKDGAIALPEATPAKDTQGFLFWQDADGNSYDAYDASLLREAELTLQAKFAKKADAEAVKSVWKLINALPEATDVTADDIEAILEAGEAYDALTDDQKALVGDKLLQKLTDDENAIVTLVNTLIDALPAADDVTLEDADQIDEAAGAYNVLTDEGKALVTNYTKLLEAQLKLVELKLDEANAALEQEQLDNEAKVKELEDKISDLTNELTDTIKKLEKAEKEDIPALQEEIADLQKKLEQTRKELAEARKALIEDSFGQLIEAAQKALDDAKAELSAAGDSIVNKALKALVETAEKALEAAKEKADDANRAMSESAKEIAAIRDQVAQASQDLAKAGEELAKAVASGAASEKEISELKDKVAEAEAAKAAAEKTAAEAEAGKQTSDDELAKTKAALAEAEAALANLKAEIAASELKVTGLKVKSKSKKFTVTWKKNASADGYKVQYRLKGKKYKTLKEVTKIKAISKKLKKGKKYQFRVATYKTVNGKKIYGKWSKVKTVKCK